MIFLKWVLLQTARWRGKQVNLENASVLLWPEGRWRWHCCCFVLNFTNFNSIPESFSTIWRVTVLKTTLSAERARSGVIAVHTKWRMLMSDNLTAQRIRLYLAPFLCFWLPPLLPMPVAKLVLFKNHRQSYSVLILKKHMLLQYYSCSLRAKKRKKQEINIAVVRISGALRLTSCLHSPSEPPSKSRPHSNMKQLLWIFRA